MLEMRDLGPVQWVSDRLLVLYPREESLRRVLALAQVDTARIPFNGIAANACWWSALQAARQGRLLKLVEVMVEEYPVDPWLTAIHSKLSRERDPYGVTEVDA